MAEIKKISTELQLLDKFLDTSGAAGSSGNVLTSTSTGTSWVSPGTPGSGIYLPLSAGSSFPLTGDLYQTLGTIGVAQTDGDYIAKIYESSADGFLSLYTGQGTPLEKIRISSYGDSFFVPGNNGNIGIGTTSPSDGKLQVYGNSSSDWGTYIYNIHANGIGLHVETNSYGTEQLLRLSSVTDSGGGNSVRMLVLANGNIGIGTITPTEKLEVNGNSITLSKTRGLGTNYATSEGWVEAVAGSINNMTGYFGGAFSRNGAAAENKIEYSIGPFNTSELVWMSVPETVSNDDGGWNKSMSGFNNSANNGFMSIVYVRRDTGAASGTFYHGCLGSATNNLDGSANGNPYFCNFGIGALPLDIWCVSIGILYAANDDTTSGSPLTGTYRMDTGEKLHTGVTYRQKPSNSTQQQRVYHYYSTSPTAQLDFAKPGWYVMDGSEPTLSDLTAGAAGGVGYLPLAGGTMTGTIVGRTAGSSSANPPTLEVVSSGTSNAQAAIAIQQKTTEGDTIIFADYDPFVEYGISTENGTDSIHFTGGTSAGSLGSRTFYNNAGNARTAYTKFKVELGSGKVLMGGDVGIRTTSPGATLELGPNGSLGANIINQNVILNLDGGYGTTGTPSGGQYKVLGFVGTTRDVSDITAQTSGEITKNFYAGIIGGDYFNGNRFSVWQAGVERLTILGAVTGSGNIGINTTNPSFQLSIENHATTTSTATMELDGKRTNGTDGPVGELIFSNNGDTFATVAGVRDVADNKGSLQFQTQDGTFGTRMTISSEGNVGIGTTAPSAKLHVSGKDDAGAGNLLNLQFDNSPIDTGLVFTNIFDTVKNRITMESGDTDRLMISSIKDIRFYTATVSQEAANLRMSIENNGNVGIGTGTTGPAAKLDVVGNIKSPTNSLSTTAAPTSFGVYTSEVRLIDTPNGGLKKCRVITDVYGEWILVGRFAASAMTSIVNLATWGSVSGMTTGTAQNETTQFSADFGDSFPEEVRIMGATDFTSWRDTRTVDFVYKVPEGRKWKFFFSGGATSGMTSVGPNHSGNNKFGWNINGSYDGFGRWINPLQTSVGMSDANVTNPSAAYTTATANAFAWDTANDAKITVTATRTFSGQDSFETAGFGNDDGIDGFFDEYPNETNNMQGGVDFSSAAWVLIKLPEGASGSGGSGTNYWAANGNDISNTNTGKVGIGTSLPGRELDVLGVIRAQGPFHSVVSSTSTNLATASGGQLNLFNSSSTNGNFSNIGGYNSNSLVTSQINFINVSHTSRTGAITFNTHNGGSMPERMSISSAGRVTINTTVVADGMCTIAGNSSNYALNLYADSIYASNYRYQRFRSGSNIAGGIEGANQTSVQYSTSSDYRMKKNIKPLKDGLDRVCKLKPVKFDWKLNDETTEGFIAHEVQDIFPDAITGIKDGKDMQGMDYGRITPLLVKAIQELKAEIELLKNK